ncbi:MAG TPA: ABC transporter substrate-binding protein [Candidatus Acidoferrales bacterium]|nr:ABC transporter substrate-binding protein [Candidatus Acidoferrales bacterium]
MSDGKLDRKSFLTTTAAVTSAGLVTGFPAILRSRASAADTLRVGLNYEYTGVYAAYAQSETRGALMAMDEWNARGGVMGGTKIEAVQEDNNNNPGNAVEKARKLILVEHCPVQMGSINSSVSLAISGACNALNVFFVDSGGHADAVTGEKCEYSTFRTCHSTWMETHATGYSLAKKFGKKWYMIIPDYAFGHALQAGYHAVGKQIGVDFVGEDLTPLGTTDFSPYLTKVLAAKPDLLLVLVQGDDFVNCLKQTTQYGIVGKVPIGGPQVELEAVWALPKEARVGYWGVEWYYKGASVLGGGNKLADAFVKKYRDKYGTPPTARSAFGYITMDRLLWTVNQAKTTNAAKMAKTLEGSHFNSIWEGGGYYRDVDHQLMWPMWVGQIRAQGTADDKYDIFDIVDRQEAEAIEQSVDEKKAVCHMNWPT